MQAFRHARTFRTVARLQRWRHWQAGDDALIARAEAAVYRRLRACIASGYGVLEIPGADAQVKATVEVALARCPGKPAGVMVRTAAGMAAVLEVCLAWIASRCFNCLLCVNTRGLRREADMFFDSWHG